MKNVIKLILVFVSLTLVACSDDKPEKSKTVQSMPKQEMPKKKMTKQVIKAKPTLASVKETKKVETLAMVPTGKPAWAVVEHQVHTY